MASPRLFMPRSLAFISAITLSGGYFMLRPRPLQRENRPGDYSVSVDRSGGGI